MKKYIVMAVSLLMSFTVITPAHAAQNWSGEKTITKIVAGHNGGFVIYFDSEVNTACTSAGTNSLYVSIGYGLAPVVEAGAAAMLSMAMTAFATGMKVNVLYDDSTSYCRSWNIALVK